jgi:hypothetical protein
MRSLLASRSAFCAAALVGAVATVSLSCGGRTAKAPDGVDSASERKLLGDEPDFAVVVRMDRIRNDIVYVSLMREAEKKYPSDIEKTLAKVDAVDLVGMLDGNNPKQASIILTVRGAPPYEDIPSEWRKELEKSETGHALSPSGVWELATIGSDGWPWGMYVTAHDWVLLAGHAAGHGHDYFAANTAPPPAVDFGDDALIGIWIGPNTMKRAAMKEEANEPGSKGLEGARLILRDGAHGDLLYEGLYDTSAHADEAVAVINDQVGMYASVWKSLVDKCPGIGVMKFEAHASGRTATMHVEKIPQMIHAAIECSDNGDKL